MNKTQSVEFHVALLLSTKIIPPSEIADFGFLERSCGISKVPSHDGHFNPYVLLVSLDINAPKGKHTNMLNMGTQLATHAHKTELTISQADVRSGIH